MKNTPNAKLGAAVGALFIFVTPVLAQQSNPDRNAYFGQTHSHTSWSLDAYILGNHITGPEEAYQFSLGQAIKHPAGFDVKLRRPLDFQGVTDHSEYVGMVRLANDPTSPVSKLPIAEKLKVRQPSDVVTIYKWLAGSVSKGEPIKELLDPKITGTVWQENIRIADKYNQPGKFTTFVAYEWTSMPNARNMHRNVFFKDSKKVPAAPFTSIDSSYPNDLWDWMDGQRKAGNELLAISHNANLSDGIMFPVNEDYKGRAIDAAWAQQRMTNEPLTEMTQIKGTSETNPALSPNDEFANFELMSFLLGIDNSKSKPNGSYVREAYQNGLAMQATRGYNPYKMGVVGASDSHNTVISYTASNFFGQHGSVDATPQLRLSGKEDAGLEPLLTSTSGLGGVWAEENTRESIFAAMQRKEVFATSGVRIKVRLFGGWDFTPAVLKQKDWAKAGYAQGVPMGGDLSAPKAKAPSFIVQAIKDPDEGNLDRVQIIKGWTKNGQIFEKVYDVAWSGNRKPDAKTGKVPAVGNTVDIKNASFTNTIGAVELKTVWTDPEFDASQDAFYYARVLQIPTPRWSTLDAKKLGVPPPSGVPATVQERAWSSPIWYTPTAAARQNAAPGVTVADLKQKGAMALDDAQLKQLAVGQILDVRNTVTGERVEILYGADGRRTITGRGGKPGPATDYLATSELGLIAPQSAAYEIRNGRVVTMLNGVPFEVAVFKTGDKYVAARSSEYGYANYELTPVKQ
ncbi:MAG: DUF3604 domain-containing protein [Casimicrobiaceae bacterium]